MEFIPLTSLRTLLSPGVPPAPCFTQVQRMRRRRSERLPARVFRQPSPGQPGLLPGHANDGLGPILL